ncbi:phytoene/squalene synthase family protein [Fontivita pretiosa]|uniref:phytoene/squalene synthase family protein n=1 Tax=Fontivita pretiosa TaxID=2989684 RepID=UPI003D183DF9
MPGGSSSANEAIDSGVGGDASRARCDAGQRAFAAARQLCRQATGGYFYAIAMLPGVRRDAACAVLALCSMLRDAMAAPGREAMVRERIEAIYTGALQLPLVPFRSPQQHTLHAFELAARQFEIPKQDLLDFADACEADLHTVRYATWASLEKHCRSIGGSVARMLGCVLGMAHSDAAQYATAMGAAMRLTNILHELQADLSRGRIYLPLEDLARCGYGERQLQSGQVNDRFGELMRMEIGRARQLYRQAAEGICWLAGDRSRLAVSIVAVMHASTLDAIERAGYDIFKGQVRLDMFQLAMRLPRALRLARRTPDAPIPDRCFNH